MPLCRKASVSTPCREEGIEGSGSDQDHEEAGLLPEDESHISQIREVAEGIQYSAVIAGIWLRELRKLPPDSQICLSLQ